MLTVEEAASVKKPRKKVSEATKKRIAKSVEKTHRTGQRVTGQRAKYAKAAPEKPKAANKPAAKKAAVKKPRRPAKVATTLGEKIGGSRADRAKKRGALPKDPNKDIPKWRQRFLAHSVEGEDESGNRVTVWMVLNRRTRSKRGFLGLLPVCNGKVGAKDSHGQIFGKAIKFESRELAELSIPGLAAAEEFTLREDGPAYKNEDGSEYKDENGKPVPAVSVYTKIASGSKKGWAGEVVAGPFPGKKAASEYVIKNAVELLSKKPKPKKTVDEITAIRSDVKKNEDGSDFLNADGKRVLTYRIYRRVSGGHLIDSGAGTFDTWDQANKYVNDHAEEFLKRGTSGYGEEFLAIPGKTKRDGPTWRDHDAKPEEFLSAFNLRGAEFGHWQGTRQSVLNHAYDALMDLADTLGVDAKALSLHRVALAFGARGRGGKGGARAHYEPTYAVMNLTKTQGAGTLAHEWAHSFDHFLAILDDPKLGERVKSPDGHDILPVTKGMEPYIYGSHRVTNSGYYYGSKQLYAKARDAYHDLMKTMMAKDVKFDRSALTANVDKSRAMLAERIAGVRDDLSVTAERAARKRPATPDQLRRFDDVAARMLHSAVSPHDLKWQWDGRRKVWSSPLLDEMDEVYKEVRGKSGLGKATGGGALGWVRHAGNDLGESLSGLAALNSNPEASKVEPTAFLEAALKLDKTRSTPYWTTKHELFARAFSSYIEDKLIAQGRRSDYLSYGSDNKLYAFSGFAPFPDGDERKLINEKMDALFNALKEAGIMTAAKLKPKKAFKKPPEPKAAEEPKPAKKAKAAKKAIKAGAAAKSPAEKPAKAPARKTVKKPGKVAVKAPAKAKSTVDLGERVKAVKDALGSERKLKTAIDSLRSNKSLKKEHIDHIAHKVTGGRKSWKTKKAALEAIHQHFIDERHNDSKMKVIEKSRQR